MLAPPKSPTVSVVVVSYNVRRHLLATLRGVFASQGPSVEVIVVDNASRDGSADAVAHDFPEVRLIRLSENIGFGAANNLALRECSGSQVLLLNPDVILDSKAIQSLSTFLAAHPEIGAVGPRLVLPDGRPDRASRRTFPTPWVAAMRLSGLSRLFPRSARLARYNVGHVSPESIQEVDSGSGACLLLQRQALEEIDYFDTDYFLYGEDLDLCLRLRSRGWKTYYLPAARAVHTKGASASQNPERSVYEFHRAMWVFYTKHYSLGSPAPVRAAVWSAIWARWMLMAVRCFLIVRWQRYRATDVSAVDWRYEEVANDA